MSSLEDFHLCKSSGELNYLPVKYCKKGINVYNKFVTKIQPLKFVIFKEICDE